MFEERDEGLILSIPLHTTESDKWYWRKEKLSLYSVKSTYALIQENKQSGHTSDNSGFWK